MTVTGPGAWLLGHGEQGIRDVRQEAVQVKHVGFCWHSFRLVVHLIGPFFQLSPGDLTLEHKAKESEIDCTILFDTPNEPLILLELSAGDMAMDEKFQAPTTV